MTSIPTTADLLRLLREDPDFRDEVRRLVLSQDLLDMPERLARFEAYVERQFTEVRGEISRNTSDIGKLKGSEYERKVSRVFTSYASTAFRRRHNGSLRRNSLLLGAGQTLTADFLEILDSAVERGEISEDELESLRLADAVMVGQHQGEAVYFVGEFSVTVNNRDIDRAIERASILRKATGADAWPMVIGDTIPDPQRAKAEAEGVAIRQVAE